MALYILIFLVGYWLGRYTMRYRVAYLMKVGRLEVKAAGKRKKKGNQNGKRREL